MVANLIQCQYAKSIRYEVFAAVWQSIHEIGNSNN